MSLQLGVFRIGCFMPMSMQNADPMCNCNKVCTFKSPNQEENSIHHINWVRGTCKCNDILNIVNVIC
jgi:hypothetical protein